MTSLLYKWSEAPTVDLHFQTIISSLLMLERSQCQAQFKSSCKFWDFQAVRMHGHWHNYRSKVPKQLADDSNMSSRRGRDGLVHWFICTGAPGWDSTGPNWSIMHLEFWNSEGAWALTQSLFHSWPLTWMDINLYAQVKWAGTAWAQNSDSCRHDEH